MGVAVAQQRQLHRRDRARVDRGALFSRPGAGVNRAWGTKEYTWWRLPIKNLFMTAILASALLIGILLPLILGRSRHLLAALVGSRARFPIRRKRFQHRPLPGAPAGSLSTVLYVLQIAPRQRDCFAKVWIAALFVTLGVDVLSGSSPFTRAMSPTSTRSTDLRQRRSRCFFGSTWSVQ
jgi:hypothetical protein